jgi:uncharacterized protein
MMRVIIALTSGALFGAGLAFSGMADPARVQGFLDLFGAWDPTLAFVMGGAILPMSAAWLWQKRLTKPLADARFELPATTKLDTKLAVGAVLFGMGWGLSGLCPGPAAANLGLVPLQVLPFILAMLAGMTAHRFTTR